MVLPVGHRTTLNQFICLKSDFLIMQESTKTKTFVGGAALMVVAAAVSHFASQPRVASDFAKVGEPFFESFDSSDQATSLEVVAIDPETVERNRFKVAKVDGLWRIPSHENYPAEASARLATTASSIIGIERESLAGRGKTDFERLGVEDPLDDDIEDPEAVGQRITLKDEKDETLADYIIGKQVEDVAQAQEDRPFGNGENRQTYFYVRHADEQQTYIVPLQLDLSTKFSDWIDPDLLRFETSDLSQITVRNYSLEEQAGGNPLIPQRALVKKVRDTLDLTKSDSGSWELAGVEEENEEFDSAGVTEMIGVLDELRIEDVRRKLTFQGKELLTPDLKLNDDPALRKSPEQFNRAIERLLGELEEKGFNLAGTQQQLELVSNNGEIEFGTTDGLRYTLHIGAPFEEGGGEIEVAGAVDSAIDADAADNAGEQPFDAEPKLDEETGSSDGNENGDESADEEADTDDETEEDAKSRYMLVRVELDQSLLTDQPEEPTKPTEPQKPKGYTPPPAPEDNADDSDAADETANGDSESDENPGDAEEDAETESDSDDAPARSEKFEAYDVGLEKYDQAKVDYELALTRYEDDKKDFAERVQEAKKLESELNERFGEWYYVISGANLQALQVSRDDLVTEIEPPTAPEVQPAKALPNRPDISFEGGPEEEGDDSSDVPSEEKDSSDSSDMETDAPAADADETESSEPVTEEIDSTDLSEVEEPSEAETDAPASAPVPKPPTTPPAPADPAP